MKRNARLIFACLFSVLAASVLNRAALSADVRANSRSAESKTPNIDWAQWGGSSTRNNTPEGHDIPSTWSPGKFDYRTGAWDKRTAKNIKWVAKLGSKTRGNPVVSGGKVFVGTNNSGGWLKRYDSNHDLGVLLAFDANNGKFLWQHSSEKLPTGRVHDWPLEGCCSSPLVEGNRLWFVTNRGEVVCLDTEGFYDGKDDGPVTNGLAALVDILKSPDPAQDKVSAIVKELDAGKVADGLRKMMSDHGFALASPAKVNVKSAGKSWDFRTEVDGHDREVRITLQGPRLVAAKVITPADKEEADVIWTFDMMKELGISQHNMANCSVTSAGDLLFVCTSNGVDVEHNYIPMPQAPSFFAINKYTKKVAWTDNSPGYNILHGQWSSPAYAILGGVPQVIFGGGDGYLYSFAPEGDGNGHSKLLWKFDCNPKTSHYSLNRATRNHIIGTPVIADGLVFVGVGEDPEHEEGSGHLWCIDPTKYTDGSDVSPQLAFNSADPSKPIPPKRIQAVEPEKGDFTRPNPKSAAVWHYGAEYDQKGNEIKRDFTETMHRTIGSAVVKDGILYIGDFSGLFHCLNAKTGKPYWTYDMLATSWGSPLVVDGKVYIGDENGNVSVFRHSSDPNVALKKEKGEMKPFYGVVNMDNGVCSTPIVAGNVLFIANSTNLFAITKDGK
jgi:outer membrane protein assembly factor BamB